MINNFFYTQCAIKLYIYIVNTKNLNSPFGGEQIEYNFSIKQNIL